MKKRLIFLATLILIALGGVVAIGTIIPQGLSYVAYIELFGLKMANLIRTIHFDDIYHHKLLWGLAIALGVSLLWYLGVSIKGKWSLKKLGRYLFHGGLVLVLVASAMIYGTGKEEKLDLRIGEKIESQVFPGVSVSLDDFEVAFYEDGLPKQYLAKVSFFDKGTSVTDEIKVNEPLYYKGYRLYQDSYAWEAFGTYQKDAEKRPFHLKMGEQLKLDKGVLDTLFLPSYDETTKDVVAPAPSTPHLLVRYQGDAEKEEVIIPLKKAGKIAGGSVSFEGFKPCAGLYLKSAKGLGLLKLGYGFLILGSFICLYQRLRGRRLWN